MFERSIHPETWRLRNQVIPWADGLTSDVEHYESAVAYASSDDPLVRQGHELVTSLKETYHNKYAGLAELRILIHLPDPVVSPGGHSVFSNIVNSLKFLGIATQHFGDEGVSSDVLERFRPSVLLVSDYMPFIGLINWKHLASYRAQNRLLVGLTASLAEYGNSPLGGRLKWAGDHGVDFYFSFRAAKYVATRMEYAPFAAAGYRILSIEFGVNPLVYYPVPIGSRNIDYVFLASSNRDKLSRYIEWLTPIISESPGVIDGPGWSGVKGFMFNADRDRYVYSRAKVGLNLHLDEQITWANELNERTYMLAACGAPQLVDNPKLLGQYFSANAFFVASSPKEYVELFREMLVKPEICTERALLAQNEVFQRHSTFHRVDAFAQELQGML